MGQDSLENVHAMSFTVNSPAEISVAFDSISYNKGASVLRMIEHLMGPNNFQAALRAYLRLQYVDDFAPENNSIVSNEYLHFQSIQKRFALRSFHCSSTPSHQS